MIFDPVRESLIIEYLPFQESNVGFALPLLAHPREPTARLIQEVDEFDGTVSNFRVLEGEVQRGVPIERPRSVKVGGPIIHVFITQEGAAHVGSLTELETILKRFAANFPDKRSVVLQIYELVGTDVERRAARAQMHNFITQRSGSNAAQSFYSGSVLRSTLWDGVLAAAPNAESAQRILRVRSKLGAAISENGRLELDLSALDPRDSELIDLGRLTSEILSKFDITPAQTLPPLSANEDPSSIIQSGRVSEILRRAKAAGRQEERVAILIDALLEDRDTGFAALTQYGKDRAQFANWALQELRSHFFAREDSRKNDQLIVAHLIPRFFSHYYTLSRGELLLYLATHLAKWPAVNQALRQTLNRTASVFVNNFRKRIDQILTEADQRH